MLGIKLKTINTLVFAMVAFSTSQSVFAARVQMPADCRSVIVSRFPNWQTKVITDEVKSLIKANKFDATVARGDFDGNGKKDWATIGSVGKKQKVVLCLDVGGVKKLAVAEDDGCTDFIDVIHARTVLNNYDAAKEERLKHDSVATYCSEKSGRVFPYEKGSFRVFYHSD